jgi:hypothetical protein
LGMDSLFSPFSPLLASIFPSCLVKWIGCEMLGQSQEGRSKIPFL